MPKPKLGKLWLMVKADGEAIQVRRVYEVRDESTNALFDVHYGEAIELTANEQAQVKNLVKSLSRRLALE